MEAEYVDSRHIADEYMNSQYELFYEILCDMEENSGNTRIDESLIDQDYLPSLRKLKKIIQYVEEVNEVSKQIAEGNFEEPVSKDNPFAGSIKELQSILRHLRWQLGEVAQGDFSQSIDYLGELSETFNKMIEQLKRREDTLKENMRLNEENLAFRTQLLENELKNQKDKYQQFSDSVSELRSYRHDMKNHLLCIVSLLEANELEEAQKYIHSMIDVFHSQSIQDCNENYMLGALLTEKMKEAYKYQISIIKHIELYRKLHIENQDWCIIMGNALDNALEALRNVDKEKRILKISLKNVKDMLIIRIENERTGLLLPDGLLFKTTKGDEHFHGIGLKNIKKCIENYQGDLKIETTDTTFVLTIILLNV